MKGLFKSKPRTPAEIVRLTRDLLVQFDMNSIRESKRDEKVIFHTIDFVCDVNFVFLLFCNQLNEST